MGGKRIRRGSDPKPARSTSRATEPLLFIELRPFTRGWQGLSLSDDDLAALQQQILLDPTGGPLVTGTGGLRKMRFAPAGRGSGKRGALRVGYVYLERHATVLLVVVYPKSRKDDLSPAEREAIRRLIEEVEREYKPTEKP